MNLFGKTAILKLGKGVYTMTLNLQYHFLYNRICDNNSSYM